MSKKDKFDCKANEELTKTGEYADNRNLFTSVEALANSLVDIMTYSDNPMGTAYTLRPLISAFYNAGYQIETMLQQIGEAYKNSDSVMLKRLEKKVNYITINKAFHMEWNALGRAWDAFLADNELLSPEFPLSDEIMKNRREYSYQADKKQIEESTKSLMFSLTNRI